MTPSCGPGSASYTATSAIGIARSRRSTTRGDSTREMRTCWRPLGDTYGYVPSLPGGHRGEPPCARPCPGPHPHTTLLGLELLQLEGRAGHAPCCSPELAAYRHREAEEGPSGANACCCYYWERRPDSLLSLLPVIHPATDTTLWASLERVDWTAQAQSLRGDTAAARLYFDSVVVLLNVEERAHPDERGPHGLRGLALAALGRRAEALREADWLERFDDYPANRWSRGTDGTGQ